MDETKGIPDKLAKRPQQDNDKSTAAIKAAIPAENLESSKGKSPPDLSKSSPKPSAVKAKQDVPNLLLPPFKSTYRTASRPGLIEQLSRLFQIGSSAEPKHVDLCNPPKIKRALSIGIHGYFPTPLIRSVLGQPTGTSVRFANNAAQAIQRWTINQGYTCEIEKVALEGTCGRRMMPAPFHLF